MTDTAHIESLLRWGKEKEVPTKRGPRLLRKGRPTDDFWLAWKTEQTELQAAGISVQQDRLDPSKWWVMWWRELPPEVTQERERLKTMSTSTDAEIIIPAPAGCEYMPFQKAGIAYCLDKFKRDNMGVLIADEPGLGKTLQAIGVINAIQDISRVLIIVPLTLKGNWERELQKWLVRPMTIGHANSEYFPRTDIVIIHYNILHKFPSRLANYWDLVIIDESQKIKNSKSRMARCVLGYKPSRKESDAGMVPTSGIPARRKLALSGTPFENRPAELFPIISYLSPLLFTSRWAFEARYCEAHNSGFGYEAKGASNLQELSDKLKSNCLVRRRKSEVLTELPPKTRQIIEMDTAGFEDVIRREQKAWHQHESDLENAQAALELAKTSGDESAFKASVDRLRNSASLIFSEISRVRHETAVAKVPAMIEMLNDELEEIPKIICGAHHRDVIMAMSKAFPGISVTLTGETPADERDRNVQRFQNDPKCRLFFGSIRAAGVGITLTASSHVRFLECDWTASWMLQFADRAHRIGQKDNVHIRYYILPGTIDAHMIQTWIRKEEILEMALDGKRQEIANEATLIPKAESLATRKELEQDSISITRAMASEILSNLKALNASRVMMTTLDRRVLESLAVASVLTPMQAALGQRLLRKHKK